MRTRILAIPTFYNNIYIYIYINVNDKRGHGIIVLECAPQIELLVGVLTFNY